MVSSSDAKAAGLGSGILVSLAGASTTLFEAILSVIIIIIIIIIVYFPSWYKYHLVLRFCDFTQNSEKKLIPEP